VGPHLGTREEVAAKELDGQRCEGQLKSGAGRVNPDGTEPEPPPEDEAGHRVALLHDRAIPATAFSSRYHCSYFE
jgi:hypothetical protein